jgi:hypothetical protein
MTASERMAAVETLGYTPREDRFLTIAALHSGYFLRRQFTAFAGVGIVSLHTDPQWVASRISSGAEGGVKSDLRLLRRTGA